MKIKIKLSIIGFLNLRNIGFEKLVDIILDKQGMSKNAHDLNNWTPNLIIMFNDTNETVCDDSNMYLNTDGILVLTPKELDLEMLLNPFKEQFNLPSVFIKERDFTCLKIEVVGVLGERSMQIWSIVDDTSDRNRIIAFIPFASKSDSLVSKDIISSFKQVFSILNIIVRMEFLSDNEEGTSLFNGKETSQVKVTTVKDIACKPFIINPIHKVDVMNLGCGDPVEDRNLCGNINLRVNSDTTLGASELGPSKNREAEVDDCGVNRIKSTMKFKLLGDSSLLSLADHIEGKLLIDSVITESVGLGDDASIRSDCSDPQIVRTFGMSLDNVNKFPETDTTRKLCKYKHTKMIPMSKSVSPAKGCVAVQFFPFGSVNMIGASSCGVSSALHFLFQ